MHLIGFGMSVVAVAALTVFMLPLGMLFLTASNMADFRSRSWPEQLLWSIALGVPVSMICANLLERVCSQTVTVAIMLLAAAVSAALVALRLWRSRASARGGLYTGSALLLMLLAGLYILLATTPVQSGPRIYESIAAGDWSVRVPLLDMAIHRGEPLINPFYGIENQTAPIRYYYYWSVLCGLAGRSFHMEARPLLQGSCVWAAWMLASVAFLLFKYLFKPRAPVVSLRRMCLLLFPVSCILGLDLLGFVARAKAEPGLLVPELDWWRASSDFSMSFHTAVLFAPHHAVGMASMFLCFLLLLPSEQTGLLGSQAASTREKVWRAVAAGLCAAAIVGCSTYMAFFLALSCLALLVQPRVFRNRSVLWTMLVAGALALVLSVPFLRDALHTTAHSMRAEEHAHALRFAPRSASVSKDRALDVLDTFHIHHNRLYEFPFRVLYFIGYTAIEVGFFGYILYLRTREDWRNRKHLSLVERAQWALVFGIGIPGLVLNSDTLAGVNDLGHHAGLDMRLIAVLWATPVAARFIYDRTYQRSVTHSASGNLALATVLLGLSAQVYQVLSQRFFLYASEHNWTTSAAFPFPYTHHTGEYYHDLYYGYQQLKGPNAPQGRVLYNPTGRMVSAPMLYQTRFSVAPEPSCMTAFGGDIQRCEADMPAIQELFGGEKRDIFYPRLFTPFRRESMTMEAFAQVCHTHAVAVVIVSDMDPVWKNKESFVWQAVPFYSTSHVRFMTCPGTTPGNDSSDGGGRA